MQHFQDDVPLAMPNPARQAYAKIIRRTESSRDIEYRVFACVTAALQDATSPDTHFSSRLKAIHHNRELWQTLACDLADDGNMLPGDLKAKLLGLAIWVTRETSRVASNGSSLDALINVNKSIMQGLRPPIGEAA